SDADGVFRILVAPQPAIEEAVQGAAVASEERVEGSGVVFRGPQQDGALRPGGGRTHVRRVIRHREPSNLFRTGSLPISYQEDMEKRGAFLRFPLVPPHPLLRSPSRDAPPGPYRRPPRGHVPRQRHFPTTA